MKTAVEWLEEIAMNGFITPEDFEQAKKMEQQQLIDKYQNGYLDSELDKLMKYKSE
jgi:hypothetical protein